MILKLDSDINPSPSQLYSIAGEAVHLPRGDQMHIGRMGEDGGHKGKPRLRRAHERANQGDSEVEG